MKNPSSKKTKVTVESVVKLLSDKKDFHARVRNGESIKTIAEEKGYKLVLPL